MKVSQDGDGLPREPATPVQERELGTGVRVVAAPAVAAVAGSENADIDRVVVTLRDRVVAVVGGHPNRAFPDGDVVRAATHVNRVDDVERRRVDTRHRTVDLVGDPDRSGSNGNP